MPTSEVSGRPASTMAAAVLYGPGDLRIERRPVPAPGPVQVLVRVGSVGVCGSDVHYFEHGRIADFVVRAPLVLGHETYGVIAAAGEAVPAKRVGEAHRHIPLRGHVARSYRAGRVRAGRPGLLGHFRISAGRDGTRAHRRARPAPGQGRGVV